MKRTAFALFGLLGCFAAGWFGIVRAQSSTVDPYRFVRVRDLTFEIRGPELWIDGFRRPVLTTRDGQPIKGFLPGPPGVYALQMRDEIRLWLGSDTFPLFQLGHDDIVRAAGTSSLIRVSATVAPGGAKEWTVTRLMAEGRAVALYGLASRPIDIACDDRDACLVLFDSQELRLLNGETSTPMPSPGPGLRRVFSSLDGDRWQAFGSDTYYERSTAKPNWISSGLRPSSRIIMNVETGLADVQ